MSDFKTTDEEGTKRSVTEPGMTRGHFTETKGYIEGLEAEKFERMKELAEKSKPTGKKYDADKLRYDLVDELAQRELVAVLSFGAIKYDAGNWKLVEDAIDRYYAAAKRHLAERRLGGTRDKESGLLTLGHALCCIHFLLALDAGEEEATEDFDERFAGAMKVAHAFRAAREAQAKAKDEELKARARELQEQIPSSKDPPEHRPYYWSKPLDGIPKVGISTPEQRDAATFIAAILHHLPGQKVSLSDGDIRKGLDSDLLRTDDPARACIHFEAMPRKPF